jgi:phytanoyl-CoA hydroxylase
MTKKSVFEQNGFLILENFVEESACDVLRHRAGELLRDFDPGAVASVFSTKDQTRTSDDYFLNSGGRVHFFFEEDAFSPDGRLQQAKELSINKIGHALHDLDPVFVEFSRTARIAELIDDLGICEPLLMQSMYIFKQPHIGGEVRCHQDSTFLFTEPESVVGLWFALEDATIENGCMWAIPGGHKIGLKSRFIRNGGDTRVEVYDSSAWSDEELVPLEAAKGSLIVLHGRLPHLSRANLSPQSRHAYTLHVIDGRSHYPTDNWLQRPADMPARGF